MKRWEYHTCSIYPRDLYHKCLNRIGREGWELVTVIPTTEAGGSPGSPMFIFKRQIEEKPSENPVS